MTKVCRSILATSADLTIGAVIKGIDAESDTRNLTLPGTDAFRCQQGAVCDDGYGNSSRACVADQFIEMFVQGRFTACEVDSSACDFVLSKIGSDAVDAPFGIVRRRILLTVKFAEAVGAIIVTTVGDVIIYHVKFVHNNPPENELGGSYRFAVN